MSLVLSRNSILDLRPSLMMVLSKLWYIPVENFGFNKVAFSDGGVGEGGMFCKKIPDQF